MSDRETHQVEALAHIGQVRRWLLTAANALSERAADHDAGKPEHVPDGIADMDLLQVLEMLCDWKASTGRMNNGDLRRSIAINAERFGYGPEMLALLTNTAISLGMIDKD